MLGNSALWSRLEALELDDPRAAFRFTDRLARENGWTRDLARRATEEYKKFVYLAAVSPTPVTPSDIVDQVWHLHLTLTRSYWNDLCGAVLGKALHHEPTMGGATEDARYGRQYDETLALYRAEFGCDAPTAFWPPAAARFAGAPHQRWVDRRTHWVIAKPEWRRWAAAAGVVAASVATATAASAAEGGEASLSREVVIGGLAAAALMLAAAMFGQSRSPRKKKSKDDNSGSSVVFSCGTGGSGGKGKGDGGEGADGGGDGGGDGGSGCGGGGCGS